MKPGNLERAAGQLVRRLDDLGQVSDDQKRLARTFLSPAMKRANALVGQWMKDAGLQVSEDRVGNLVGRGEGSRPGAKILLLGSHLDTVLDAGRFDGALGVLLPIVALGELRRRGVQLPFAVEVIGFSEEEGVRFASAYLGSKGYAGRMRTADLKLRDARGVSVREALGQWAGPRRAGRFQLPAAAHRPKDLLGYVEVHIEQGPVLEARKLAVGVVSGIAGQTRARLCFRGRAGHAGTTPMALRRDALAGAAEFVLAAETCARADAGLVATVGSLQVSPGASNVIPAEVVLTLDVRHARDAVRRQALRRLGGLARRIARERQLTLAWEETQDNDAVACSKELTALLARSVRAQQGRCIELTSGAGHDAVVMSTMASIAMLFVRCRGGLSHHADEYVAPADIEVALRVLVDFLERLAAAVG
jgi:allantoate deiminase